MSQSKALRAVVTGGRNNHDAARVWDVLTRLGVTEIAHGGARGVDEAAGQWAYESCVPFTVFEADWAKEGRAAGPKRNERMLREFAPDIVVAFPGGRGTANCVRCAESMGIPVELVEELAEPDLEMPF